jgi:hypothetical protein
MTVMAVPLATRPVRLTIDGPWRIAVNGSRIPDHRRGTDIATAPDHIHAEADCRLRVPGLGNGNKGQARYERGCKQASVQHEKDPGAGGLMTDSGYADALNKN